MPISEAEYLFEERAAIAEHEGGLGRQEAEALARAEQAKRSAGPGIVRTVADKDDVSKKTG